MTLSELIADEVLVLSKTLLSQSLFLFIIVLIFSLIRKRISHLKNSDKKHEISASILTSIPLGYYLTQTEDLGQISWLASFTFILFLFVINRPKRPTEPATIIGWSLIWWSVMMSAKFPYIFNLDITSIRHTSQILLTNSSIIISYPLIWITDLLHQSNSQAQIMEAINDLSIVLGSRLVTLLSLASMALAYFGKHLSLYHEPTAENRSSTSALIALTTVFLLSTVRLIYSVFFSPQEQHIEIAFILLSTTTGSALLAQLLARRAGASQKKAWGLTFITQISLCFIYWISTNELLQFVAINVLLFSIAIPIWFSAKLFTQNRNGSLGIIRLIIILFSSSIFPFVTTLLIIIGIADLLFDIENIQRRPPSRFRQPLLRKSVTIQTLSFFLVMLVWYLMNSIIAYSSLPAPQAASALSQPSTVEPEVTDDPCARSQTVCRERGQHPCSAQELSCDASACSLPRMAGGRPGLICFGDEAAGLWVSGVDGFLPQWTDVATGSLPRQFAVPSRDWPSTLFSNHRLLIYCCDQHDSEEPAP